MNEHTKDTLWKAGYVLVCLVALAGLVYMPAAGLPDDTAGHINESAEWCEDRDGTLENSRVIGSHGGLHCELPNGTSVHMHEVIDS